MHSKQIVRAGKPLAEASGALILVHGRGGSAADILELATHLQIPQLALLAPQAMGHTWYPYSFLAPPSENEPWLSSAIDLLSSLTADVKDKGIASENIYFLGFSQGACLTLEFTARHAVKYGGIAAFTGGLIGDRIYSENYTGDFSGTPVFMGTSDPDPHVPVQRVHDSAQLLETMNAVVTKKVYRNMGHTISQDEINLVNTLLFKAG